VLKALGLLLIVAAALKGHELLMVPMAGKELWSWRPFLIFQVELELAMGIWLLSGVFKRLAWLTGLFYLVTFYRGLTLGQTAGRASCDPPVVCHSARWVGVSRPGTPSDDQLTHGRSCTDVLRQLGI